MQATSLFAVAALALGTPAAWAQSSFKGAATEAQAQVSAPAQAPVARTSRIGFKPLTGWLATFLPHEITVGQALPETVLLRRISRHETYRYAVMDGHRFIVDASTRRVVYVVD